VEKGQFSVPLLRSVEELFFEAVKQCNLILLCASLTLVQIGFPCYNSPTDNVYMFEKWLFNVLHKNHLGFLGNKTLSKNLFEMLEELIPYYPECSLAAFWKVAHRETTVSSIPAHSAIFTSSKTPLRRYSNLLEEALKLKDTLQIQKECDRIVNWYRLNSRTDISVSNMPGWLASQILIKEKWFFQSILPYIWQQYSRSTGDSSHHRTPIETFMAELIKSYDLSQSLIHEWMEIKGSYSLPKLQGGNSSRIDASEENGHLSGDEQNKDSLYQSESLVKILFGLKHCTRFCILEIDSAASTENCMVDLQMNASQVLSQIRNMCKHESSTSNPLVFELSKSTIQFIRKMEHNSIYVVEVADNIFQQFGVKNGTYRGTLLEVISMIWLSQSLESANSVIDIFFISIFIKCIENSFKIRIGNLFDNPRIAGIIFFPPALICKLAVRLHTLPFDWIPMFEVCFDIIKQLKYFNAEWISYWLRALIPSSFVHCKLRTFLRTIDIEEVHQSNSTTLLLITTINLVSSKHPKVEEFLQYCFQQRAQSPGGTKTLTGLHAQSIKINFAIAPKVMASLSNGSGLYKLQKSKDDDLIYCLINDPISS
jgi:hypothetical protein